MGILSAGINYRAQKLTNQTNLQIAQETNEMNRQIAEMNNKANAEAAAQQNLWNIQQWNRENAYNDPAAQAGRLRNAGLSAAAAAQAVNGGNASHLESANLAVNQTGSPMVAPHLDAPRMDFNLAQDALNIASAVGGAANAMKAFKEAKFTDELLMTQLDKEQWGVNMAKQQYFQNMLTNPHNVRLVKSQADSAQWRSQADSYLPKLNFIATKQQELNYKQTEYVFKNVNPESLRKLRAEIDNITADTKNKEATHDNIVADTANKIATHDNIVADTANKIATHDNIVADTENKLSQNANIEADTDVKRQDAWSKRISNSFAKFGMPSDAAGRIAALCADGVITPQDACDMTEHAIGFLQSSGKKFDLKPDLRQYYKFVINPSEFEKYKTQSSWRTWWQDAQTELGLPLNWGNMRKPSQIQQDWQNTR